MSGIAPSDLRNYVIRPALFIIGLGGDAAEELMLGTALQESGAGKYLSQLNGPARGVWQMEPATFNDLQTNFLASRRALSAAVDGLKAPGLEGVTQLCGNLLYACAMARLVYARHSDPLPAAGDIEAQAEYYKRIYNTAGGAATPAEYVANWKAAHP